MNILKKTCLLVLILLMGTGSAWADGRKLYYDWADVYKYQGNMMCTAIVKLNGQVLTNVELAAFDSKGELRGSVLSQDTPGEDGRCYLSIQGEGSKEPLHFRVVYGPDDDSRIIADAEETFTFVMDKAVGSYASPFVFNIVADVEGDVDGDGKLTLRDVCVLISQLLNPSTIDLQHSDIDKNGTVNLADVDALRILLLNKR